MVDAWVTCPNCRTPALLTYPENSIEADGKCPGCLCRVRMRISFDGKIWCGDLEAYIGRYTIAKGFAILG